MIYLDNAATTMIKPPSVRKAVLNAMKTMSSPSRGAYQSAMRASDAMIEMRETAAELFNAGESENIVFTVNATHGLNIAINTLVKPGDWVLISGFEHNSVTRALKARGADIAVFAQKLFDRNEALKSFKSKLKNIDCVVCSHVSNVFGYILPIYEIAAECEKHGVPLIVDASQSAGILSVDAKKLNAEFIAMPGHKSLFGPPGSGLLICKNSAEPILFGGSGSDSIRQTMPEYLPDRLEAGTQNVWAAAGLTAGMKFVMKNGISEIESYERRLKDKIADGLNEIGSIRVYCGTADQSGVVSFIIPGMDCEEAAAKLAEKEIYLRSGLHCSPLAHKSAGTLDTGTVRVSVSPFTTERDIERFLYEIEKTAGGI